jgi:23S rRNA (adenine1618-N6)-methyltransferase
MHPANLYCQQEPDFAALAELHPPLAPYVSVHPVTGRASIDFTSWQATQQLTAALLAVDFGIDWSLPEGQLVPPVPNRANYVHWLHDLLQLSGPSGVLTLLMLLPAPAAVADE